MAIVDRPRRVLLSAVRPCADVDDIPIEQSAVFHKTDYKVNDSSEERRRRLQDHTVELDSRDYSKRSSKTPSSHHLAAV